MDDRHTTQLRRNDRMPWLLELCTGTTDEIGGAEELVCNEDELAAGGFSIRTAEEDAGEFIPAPSADDADTDGSGRHSFATLLEHFPASQFKQQLEIYAGMQPQHVAVL